MGRTINGLDILGLCNPSLLDLFLQNVENNWQQNSINYVNGIGRAALNLANLAANAIDDPYDTAQAIDNWAGNVSADPFGSAENLANNLLYSVQASQGIGQDVFGIEAGLLTGGAFGPEAGLEAEASELTAEDVSANLTKGDQLSINQAGHD